LKALEVKGNWGAALKSVYGSALATAKGVLVELRIGPDGSKTFSWAFFDEHKFLAYYADL
jgi:hypothetical protein